MEVVKLRNYQDNYVPFEVPTDCDTYVLLEVTGDMVLKCFKDGKEVLKADSCVDGDRMTDYLDYVNVFNSFDALKTYLSQE